MLRDVTLCSCGLDFNGKCSQSPCARFGNGNENVQLKKIQLAFCCESNNAFKEHVKSFTATCDNNAINSIQFRSTTEETPATKR